MDYKKRSGMRPSPWQHTHLAYAVRPPSFKEALTLPDEYDGLADVAKCLGNQGDVGTCGGWAGAGVTKSLIALNDKRDVLPSAGSIYVHSRELSEPPITEGEGTTGLGVMKLLQKIGADTEVCAPTDTKSPFMIVECAEWQSIAKDYRIGSYHMVPTDPASMKAAIYGITYDQPYKMPDGSPGKAPLFTVIPIYYSVYTEKNGVVPMPAPGEALYGYHAVVFRGWKKINGLDHWVVANSWGLDAGDRGIYYFPVGYPITESWMVTDDTPLSPPPAPEPAPVPEPIPTPEPQPTPSPCKWGNAFANALNVVQSVRHRKGRFYYMNPPEAGVTC
jgi:hypothetical protein